VADDLDGAWPLVLHNGALVVEGNEVISCTPLAREIARRAVRLGRAQGAEAVLHCGRRGEGRLVVEKAALSSATLTAYSLDPSNPDLVTVEDLGAALDDDPIQVMFGGALEDMKVLEGHLRAGLGNDARVVPTTYPEEGMALLDVLDPRVHKGVALELLQERYGVSAAETLAIGDNWNDREMLLQAGLGLVMGNAEPGMRSLGLPLLPTNDEDGVAVAIERHILGA
jgi:hydroxymethylpyrimidine pyrophosphatase-like HAD family hydrolase